MNTVNEHSKTPMSSVDGLCLVIGKVIVNFNALELTLRRTAWFLINSSSAELAKEITKEMTVDKVIVLLFSLIKINPTNLGPEQLARLRLHLQSCDKIRIERNELAHTFFRVANDDLNSEVIYTAWPQHYKKGALFGDNKPLDMNALKNLNQRCNDSIEEGYAILDNIGAGVTFGN